MTLDFFAVLITALLGLSVNGIVYAMKHHADRIIAAIEKQKS